MVRRGKDKVERGVNWRKDERELKERGRDVKEERKGGGEGNRRC